MITLFEELTGGKQPLGRWDYFCPPLLGEEEEEEQGQPESGFPYGEKLEANPIFRRKTFFLVFGSADSPLLIPHCSRTLAASLLHLELGKKGMLTPSFCPLILSAGA